MSAGGFYYRDHAADLIARGYRVLPIRPGEKRPAATDWTHRVFTGKEPEFCRRPHGVGVVCGVGSYPVVPLDLDISHRELLDGALSLCRQHLGWTIERVGNPPRVLLVYRAAEAGWKKGVSAGFLDSRHPTKPDGKPFHQHIEVLNEGQQFVVLGVHPDTSKEYGWTDFEGGILNSRAAELIVVTAEQINRVLRDFNELGRGLAGLEQKSAGVLVQTDRTVSRTALGLRDARNSDDISEADLGRMDGVTLEDAAAALEGLDPSMRRTEGWLAVGMGLHHQFYGSDEAFDLWDEWSAGGAQYPNTDELWKQWESFGDEERLRTNQPITFRSILQMAKKEAVTAETEHRRERQQALSQRIEAAQSTSDLLGPLLRDVIALGDEDAIVALELRSLVYRRYHRLTGDALRVSDYKGFASAARRALLTKEGKQVPKATDEDAWAKRSPFWARDWVAVAGDKTFFNFRNLQEVDAEGFRLLNNHYLFCAENQKPDATAHVRDRRLIPVADAYVYWPGKPRIFIRDESVLVNTYSTLGSAEIPEVLEGAGAYAARLVKDHIKLMLTGARVNWTRECALFVNFLRYCIEFPGSKIRWAVLLQGVEGSGKTMFQILMSRILGPRNVGVTTGTTVMKAAETGFTAWAENIQMLFVEEIRLVGHNRFDVVNAMKDKISNETIEITRKGKDPVQINNIANYVLFTNFKDAVPLDENSRRYMVLFSDTPLALLAEKEPHYFEELFVAISEFAGSIARWILSVPYHEDFKANGHAPHTSDRDCVIERSKDPLIMDIVDIMEMDSQPYIGPDVLILQALRAALIEMDNDVGFDVSTNTIVLALRKMGLEPIGRARQAPGERKQSVWGKVPEALKHAPEEEQLAWARTRLRDRQERSEEAAKGEAAAARIAELDVDNQKYFQTMLRKIGQMSNGKGRKGGMDGEGEDGRGDEGDGRSDGGGGEEDEI